MPDIVSLNCMHERQRQRERESEEDGERGSEMRKKTSTKFFPKLFCVQYIRNSGEIFRQFQCAVQTWKVYNKTKLKYNKDNSQ